MIFLIDHVLPESYFANNLRALSVDMAVFRELLSVHLPTLSHHLDKLQAAARDHNTGTLKRCDGCSELSHEFHENCHSVSFYFIKKDSK